MTDEQEPRNLEAAVRALVIAVDAGALCTCDLEKVSVELGLPPPIIPAGTYSTYEALKGGILEHLDLLIGGGK